jgi:hypothetical protein
MLTITEKIELRNKIESKLAHLLKIRAVCNDLILSDLIRTYENYLAKTK